MLRSIFAIALFVVISTPLPAMAGGSGHCLVNTGLDPTCPLTAVTVSQTTGVLSSTAVQHTDDLLASLAVHGDTQITLAVPLYDHLEVANVGRAYGIGDTSAGITHVFSGRKRFAQDLALAVSFPTGATNFSSGRVELTPSYAASYAVGNRLTLLGIASYAVPAGGSKLPFAPRVQRFRFVPRAILDFPRSGGYLAADIDGQNITGDERFQQYAADGTVGFVRRKLGVSFTYREAIAYFTWHNVFEHDLLWRLSYRP